MFNVFFCRFPAGADASFDNLDKIINIFCAWINKSEYRTILSISVEDFLRQPSPAYISQRGENRGEARLERIRWSDGRKSYFGFCQTNPPGGVHANLVWQSGCIYEKSETDSAFYVFLNRGIQDPKRGERLDASITPELPAVIGKLHDENMIFDAAALADGKKVSEVMAETHKTACFPRVLIRQGRPQENVRLFHELRRRRLHFISHIMLLPEEEILQGEIPEGTDLLLYFPEFGICRSYERGPAGNGDELYKDIKIEHLGLPSDLETAAAALSWDIFRLINESQCAGAPTWDKLRLLCCGEQEMAVVSSNKCLVNGELLRQKRKESGMSQKELGELAESSGLMVSRLETNQILKASRSLVGKLERILGLPGNALVASVAGAVRTEGPMPQGAGLGSGTPQGAGLGGGTPPDPAVKMNYCRRCGTRLYQDSLFCHSCGARIPG